MPLSSLKICEQIIESLVHLPCALYTLEYVFIKCLSHEIMFALSIFESVYLLMVLHFKNSVSISSLQFQGAVQYLLLFWLEINHPPQTDLLYLYEVYFFRDAEAPYMGNRCLSALFSAKMVVFFTIFVILYPITCTMLSADSFI